MPSLNWIGKEKVINHHLDVPFHVLERKYSFDEKGQHSEDNGSENMIIHGDNLLALKSLLPKFESRIDCIYIDPPYNTGEENWVYNDNVNDPRIKKWLGEVVGKEGDDLSRHDKWLCMMYPRLQLLHRLLAKHGCIFISIDDHEQYNLKMILDEIFGASNFVATIPWRKRTAKSDVPFGLSQDCESILVYAKSNLFRAAIKNDNRKYYETEDFPNRPWRYHDLTKQTTAKERQNSFFTIVNPKTGDEYPCNPDSTWRITKDTFDSYYEQNRIIFPGDYDFLEISKPVFRYWKDEDQKKNGEFFGYTSVSSFLPEKEVGMTKEGTKEIKRIFGSKIFNYPKPVGLIEYLIEIATNIKESAIILDSFAGTGTTAHAVMRLNKKYNKNHKYVLVEMENYAEEFTAERVKRVIKGYSYKEKVKRQLVEFKEQIDGDFSFFELGNPLIKDGFINPQISISHLREYVYFSETNKRLHLTTECSLNKYYLGTEFGVAYYLIYEKERSTTLDHSFIKNIKEQAEWYVVYADKCFLSESELRNNHIIFKKIPRDITVL